MSSQSPSTPAAIVLGSAIIGACIYFGLRERAPAPPASAARSAEPASQRTAVAPAAPPAPSAAATVSREALGREAAGAMEAHRALVVAKCWRATGKVPAAPSTARVVLNFTFDASGATIARGIAEDRANARPGLGACVSQELPEIAVSPPGQTVYLEVPFTLP